MKIAIDQPVGFNEPGGRSNNEDAIFPVLGSATTADKLFLVCDGVGGEHKGEVASTLACEALHAYFDRSLDGERITSDSLHAALAYTSQLFGKAEKADPDTGGMATTMTMIHFQDDGVAAAHLGDSRIYQIRHGKVIYRSKDHKWVNELIESGVITEQQALEHPKRNVITRVISAGRNDAPAFVLIKDVQPGDYFFMCTDGVLERVYDELLVYHLRDDERAHGALEPIMEAIREECEGKTNDNFSAYLIRVADVASGVAERENVRAGFSLKDDKTRSEKSAGAPSSMQRHFRALFFWAVGVALCGSVFTYWQKTKRGVRSVDKQPTQILRPDSVVALPAQTVAEKQIRETRAVRQRKKPLGAVVAHKPGNVSQDSVQNKANITLPGTEATDPAPQTPVVSVEPVVKSEKSDLPSKLKKIDPKPND